LNSANTVVPLATHAYKIKSRAGMSSGIGMVRDGV
jgi:hypothetical protein